MPNFRREVVNIEFQSVATQYIHSGPTKPRRAKSRSISKLEADAVFAFVAALSRETAEGVPSKYQ